MEQTRCKQIEHCLAQGSHHLVPANGLILRVFRNAGHITVAVITHRSRHHHLVVLLPDLRSSVIYIGKLRHDIPEDILPESPDRSDYSMPYLRIEVATWHSWLSLDAM
jgi:hypothetical protein